MHWKQNLSKTEQSVMIWTMTILLHLQKFWTIMKIREICISISSKNNQLKISFCIGIKNNFVSTKFLSFFSMIKQLSPKLIIKVLLGTNTNLNIKNTIITEIWWCGHNKKQNLSKTDQSVAICILLIPLLSHKFWKIMKIREICISIIIKKNQLKSSSWIGTKNNLVSIKFLSFSAWSNNHHQN